MEDEKSPYVDFEAVVLCVGAPQLPVLETDASPVSVLPVGNRTVLEHQVRMLTQCGVQRVHVCCTAVTANAFRELLEHRQMPEVHLQVIEAEDDGYVTECGALRELLRRDVFAHSTSEIVLLSADALSNVPLHFMREVHVSRHAAATMLLWRKQRGKLRHLARADIDAKFIALAPLSDAQGRPSARKQEDELAQARLVAMHAFADIEGEKLLLPRRVLRENGDATLHSTLGDAHLALVSRWTLQFLLDEEAAEFLTVFGELLPYIVRHQHVPQSPLLRHYPGLYSQPTEESMPSTPRSSFALSEPERAETSEETRLLPSSRRVSAAVRCFATVAPCTAIVARVSSLQSLLRATRCVAFGSHSVRLREQIERDDKAAQSNTKFAAADEFDASCGLSMLTRGETSQYLYKRGKQLKRCCVDASVLEDLGQRDSDSAVSLHNCVVGRHVKLGAGASLENCVIMDYAVIGEHTRLCDTVLGVRAQVGAHASLTNCTVAHAAVVPDEYSADNEQFTGTSGDDDTLGF